MKIVVYGFGIVGKNLFRMFFDLGFDCVVIDDNPDEFFSEHIKIFKIQEIKIGNNDIVILCSAHEKFLTSMIFNLKEYFGNKIEKNLTTYNYAGYSSNYKKFIDKNVVKKAILKPQSFAENIANAIKDAIKKYEISKTKYAEKNILAIKSRDASKNVFCDINNYRFCDKPEIIKYPFFSVYMSPQTEDREFDFRKKIDWELLADKHYRSNFKIICVFGNSQARGVSLKNINETFPALLEAELNEKKTSKQCIVINCSHSGDTILEEIIYYIALIDKIKPDITISMSGIDLFLSFKCDKKLIEKHAFFYKAYDEKIYKDYVNSFLPLAGEYGIVGDLDINKIFEGFFYRLKQFESIVTASGGKFIACLQPSLYSKQIKTRNEISKTKSDFKLHKLNEDEIKLYEQSDIIFSGFISHISMRQDKLAHFIDLRIYIANLTKSCFDDYIHLNGYGNLVLAKAVAEYMRDKID